MSISYAIKRCGLNAADFADVIAATEDGKTLESSFGHGVGDSIDREIMAVARKNGVVFLLLKEYHYHHLHIDTRSLSVYKFMDGDLICVLERPRSRLNENKNSLEHFREYLEFLS